MLLKKLGYEIEQSNVTQSKALRKTQEKQEEKQEEIQESNKKLLLKKKKEIPTHSSNKELKENLMTGEEIKGKVKMKKFKRITSLCF